jgi:hypothetical protein
VRPAARDEQEELPLGVAIDRGDLGAPAVPLAPAAPAVP